MKKQLIIAALLLALAVLAFMLLYTVTVYPAFQKSVGSIDTLRQALRSDAILYPAVEDLLQEPNYTLSLDGRTVFAKPVGYVIDGTEPLCGHGDLLPLHRQYNAALQSNYCGRDRIPGCTHPALGSRQFERQRRVVSCQPDLFAGWLFLYAVRLVRRSCAGTRGAAHARIAHRTGHACAGHAPIAVPADDRRILNL